MMCLDNLLIMSLLFYDSEWKYYAYIFPANLRQGVDYPGILFTFLSAFDHSGKRSVLPR